MSDEASRQPRVPHRIWQVGSGADSRPYAWLIALFLAGTIGFSVAPIYNSAARWRNKDYTLWYRTGCTMRAGGAIYPTDPRPFPFMYPPAAAALLAVGSAGGRVPFVVGLTILNSIGWLAAVLLSVFLATGRAWRQHPLFYLLPTLCVVPFIHDTYLLGQPNLALLALMLGAFACLRRRREDAAGALIALAAGIKAFPILAIGYLVYRRHWKAVGAVAVALVLLLVVLPMPFRGPSRALGDLKIWTRGMVLKYDDGGIAQRPERSFSFKNQSLIALTNRLLRPVLADGEKNKSWRVNVVELDFRAVNAVILASALGLGLFYLWAMPPREKRTNSGDAMEGAMLLLLILFFSPLSFNYFYVWLLFPLTVALGMVLAAPARSRERRALTVWLVASVVLFAAGLPFPRAAQAYGNLFGSGLLLFLGLGLALRRQTRRGSVLRAPHPSRAVQITSARP